MYSTYWTEFFSVCLTDLLCQCYFRLETLTISEAAFYMPLTSLSEGNTTCNQCNHSFFVANHFTDAAAYLCEEWNDFWWRLINSRCNYHATIFASAVQSV